MKTAAGTKVLLKGEKNGVGEDLLSLFFTVLQLFSFLISLYTFMRGGSFPPPPGTKLCDDIHVVVGTCTSKFSAPKKSEISVVVGCAV